MNKKLYIQNKYKKKYKQNIDSSLPAHRQHINSIQAAYSLNICSVVIQSKHSCSSVYVQCITGHILDKYWTNTGQVLDIYTVNMLFVRC